MIPDTGCQLSVATTSGKMIWVHIVMHYSQPKGTSKTSMVSRDGVASLSLDLPPEKKMISYGNVLSRACLLFTFDQCQKLKFGSWGQQIFFSGIWASGRVLQHLKTCRVLKRSISDGIVLFQINSLRMQETWLKNWHFRHFSIWLSFLWNKDIDVKLHEILGAS